MNGTITADREAMLSLLVRGPSGRHESVDAILDTGFNGFLTLPATLIAALGLPYYSRTVATLGDGSSVALRIYKATVLWDGQELSVFVLAADGGPLIGMSLLYGNRVTLDVVDGGSVTTSPLP